MLHVALLGRYNVRLNNEPINLALRPVQLLLAYLLLSRDKKHRREQLAGILWPDYTDASARKNLRNTIYRLRKAVGDIYLLADRSSVAFNTGAPYWLDVAQLEQATTTKDIKESIKAIDLYQGELLPGFYEDWILWERERLLALFERQMQDLLERLNAAGRWSETLTWAENWIAQGQAPEPAYRALMQAHASLGDQSSMAQAYHRGRRVLEETLDVPPSAETERLYRELLERHSERIPTPAEQVASTADKTPSPKSSSRLPVPETRIIGRQRELAELQRLLRQETGGRLVTIVGPGGIGKTWLSLETAAASAESFPDGVFFVRLAPLTDAQHMVATISDSIGFRYMGAGDPRQALLDYLAQKHLLLVLDNFEHLLNGTDLVSDILKSAPLIKMLCTSRERLNLSSEAIYVLSGLDYPAQPHLPNEELTRFGAVELLLDRAELIHPRPEAGRLALVQVARICHLVQGMPLALVLASGWLELLSFEEVADEIASSLDILESQARDIPERQRSVRAAFEYSWQRLAVDDQETFSRLAVFRGGFNRQAANQVAGARLRTLRKLVEKSLITAEGPDRYAVHELLRQFAEEKLEAVGQAITTRDAHSSYYLEAIGKREVDLKGRHQLEALEDIEGELDNLRAAWTWALKRQDDNDIDRAQESISLFCYMRSRNQEGWTLFQHALQRLAAKESPTDQRALDDQERLMGRLKARSGLLHSQFAKSAPEIEGAIRESLAVAEVNSDEAEIAYSNLALGHYHSRVTGNFEQALSHFELSLERYQSLAELYYVAHTLHRVGYCHAFVTGSEKYNDYTRQSLELAREIGDLSDAASALGNLGSSSFATGDYAAAEGYFREAISLDRQMGHRWGVAHDTIQLGLCHFLNGRFEKAQDAAAEGVTIAKDIVFPLTEAYGLAVLSLRASIDGDYRRGLSLADESLALFTNEFGISLGHWAQATACLGLNRMEQAWQHSLDALEISHRWRWDGCTTWLLPVVGIILVRLGQSERAAEIMGLYFNHPMRPAGWAEKWPLMNETQAQLKQTLGADGYRVAWERGLSMDMVTAVETLLAEVDTE